jgi:hypothetical protein
MQKVIVVLLNLFILYRIDLLVILHLYLNLINKDFIRLIKIRNS